MGLDLGTKTVGIAISDLLGLTAQGLEVYRFPENNFKQAINYINNLIADHNITKFVVGLPKNMNGSIGESGIRCQRFAERLKEATSIDVVLWDERLTTMQVEKILVSADVSRKNRKKVVDKMAAQLILQSYLDSNKF